MRYLGAAAIGAVLFGAVSIGSPASAFGGFWGAGWNGGGWQADGWHGGWCLRPGSAAGFGLSRGRVADWDCDDFYRHPGHAYAPGVRRASTQSCDDNASRRRTQGRRERRRCAQGQEMRALSSGHARRQKFVPRLRGDARGSVTIPKGRDARRQRPDSLRRSSGLEPANDATGKPVQRCGATISSPSDFLAAIAAARPRQGVDAPAISASCPQHPG